MLRVGSVSVFDEMRGLGTVAADTGASAGPGASWPFHCTAIADGTRTIEIGTRVAFEVVPGHLGRMEATQLTRICD